MKCRDRKVFFCVLFGEELWVAIEVIEPKRIETSYGRNRDDSLAKYRLERYLDEINLSDIIRARLGHCNPDDLLRMIQFAPYHQYIRAYCEDDDPDRPVIHPDNLEDWFRRAFPKLYAGKVSA